MRQTYGYIRVSTREQNEARQLDALYKAGVEEKKIYMDKQSGKDFDRKGYQRLLHRLRPGDTLFVKSIDRLGRNYNEILEQWRLITKEKNAAIVVLDMPLLDTRQDRDLTGTLIADIVLQLLSYVAQTEREFIRQRQREGIAIAREQGKYKGRKPIQPPDFDSVVSRWRKGELTAAQAMKRLGMSSSTFYRRVKEETSKA